MSAVERRGPEPPAPRRKVRADALERARQAWYARVTGVTWEQAASVAGYANPANAQRAVRTIYGTLPELDRDEERRLWRDRLGWLWAENVTQVKDREPGSVTAGVRPRRPGRRPPRWPRPARPLQHLPDGR